MIVELFGPVGSGKTTIAKQLRDSKGFVLVRINNKAELVLYGLKFYLRHPAAGLAMFTWLIFSCRLQSFFHIVVSVLLYRPAVYMKAKQVDLAVIDEGLRQNILSIFDRELTTDEIKKYLNMLPSVDLLVGVSPDEMEIDRRFEQRGKEARRPWLPREAEKKWLGVVRKNFEKMKFFLLNKDNFCVIANTEELIDCLNNLWINR